MGTALTEEQISELERVAKVLVLCLDADRAGQDAMLRAAQLTDQRKLELRVVATARGNRSGGADRARRRRRAARTGGGIGAVRRVPRRADPRAERYPTAPRAATARSAQLLPALRGLARDAFGDELLRRVAGRLELCEARLGSLIEGAAQQNG